MYLSPEKQLKAALDLDKRFNADFVTIIDDPIICCETLGAKVLKSDYDFPSAPEPLVERPTDLAALRIPDPFKTGRMPVNLESIKLLAEASGKPLFISIEGPFTLAGRIMGVPGLARAIVKSPSFIKDVLDFTTQVVAEYARAASAAGTDLISISEPTAVILPPEGFEGLVQENLQKVFDSLCCWKSLHICGNASHILYLILRIRSDGLSLDQVMDLPSLAPILPDNMVLFGNIPPKEVMVDMEPEDVRAATLDLLISTAELPYFILSTGCDLLMDTPFENMDAFMEAGRLSLSELKNPSRHTSDSPNRFHNLELIKTALDASSPKRDTSHYYILAKISEAVSRFDENEVVRWCQKAREAAVYPEDAINLGLIAGIKQAGHYCDRRIYSIPELILAADAMRAGLEIIKPSLKPVETRIKGGIMLGVVEGDMHDIGKDLAAAIFRVSGWDVADLGVNVSADGFLDGCSRYQPDIVGLSTLLSATTRLLPDLIKKIKSEYPDIMIMVGGALLTEAEAREYGADGYAPDAFRAVRAAAGLLR